MNPFKDKIYQSAIAQLKQKEALLTEERKILLKVF